MSEQLNRQALLALADLIFQDNITEMITPAQARDIIRKLIISSWNIQEDKIPFPEDQADAIAPWASNLVYGAGDQVTHGSKFWQSKVNDNANRVPAENAFWFELSPSHLPNTDTALRRTNGATLTADAIFSAMSQILLKMDRGVVFNPTHDLASLKALDTTASQDWPDRGFIYVKGLKKLFALHRDSAQVADDEEVIIPTTGPGRWVLIAGGSTAPADPPVGGEASGTLSAIVLSRAAVLGKRLTGLGNLLGGLLETDSIQEAFGKIKAFMEGIAATVRGITATGLDVNLPGQPHHTDTFLQLFGKLSRYAVANAAEGLRWEWATDYAGLATTAGTVFNRRVTASAITLGATIASVSFHINGGAPVSGVANLNAAVAALTAAQALNYTIEANVVFQAGQNRGYVLVEFTY